MFGAEYSLTVLIVSIVQGLVLLVQSVFSWKIRKVSVFNHSFFLALFIGLYNLTSLFFPVQNSLPEAIVFIILGGYYTTIRLEPLLSSRKLFFVVFSFNSLLLTSVLFVLNRLNISEVEDQLTIVSLLLLIAYVSFGFISVSRIQENFSKVRDQLLISVVFAAFITFVFLVSEREYVAIISMNLFLFGLVVEWIYTDIMYAELVQDCQDGVEQPISESLFHNQLSTPDLTEKPIEVIESVEEVATIELNNDSSDEGSADTSLSEPVMESPLEDHFSVYGLTEKQMEVIELIDAGVDIQSIANSLDVDRNTVETRLYRIYKKIPYKTFDELKLIIVKIKDSK